MSTLHQFLQKLNMLLKQLAITLGWLALATFAARYIGGVVTKLFH